MRHDDRTAQASQLELPGHENSAALPRSEAPALGCERLLVFRCTACSGDARLTASCPTVCERCPWRRQARASSTLQLLPRVPVRHWVFRPAPRDRHWLGERELLRKASRLFVGEVFETVRRLVGRTVRWDGRVVCGGVSLVHVANAALEPDVHLHALVLDGVYDWSGAEPVFVPLTDAPTAIELGELTARLQAGLRRLFGVRPGPGANGLAQRMVEGPPIRKIGAKVSDTAVAKRPRRAGLGAIRDGLQVFASDVIASEDRPALSRLVRYLTRPIPDPEAFSQTAAGAIRYRLHHPFADGTTHVEFEPETLAERLATLAPKASRGDMTLHGILAARAAKRWRVVPGQLRLFEHAARQPPTSVPVHRPRSRPETAVGPRIDPGPCQDCGGKLHLVAVEALGG